MMTSRSPIKFPSHWQEPKMENGSRNNEEYWRDRRHFPRSVFSEYNLKIESGRDNQNNGERQDLSATSQNFNDKQKWRLSLKEEIANEMTMINDCKQKDDLL